MNFLSQFQILTSPTLRRFARGVLFAASLAIFPLACARADIITFEFDGPVSFGSADPNGANYLSDAANALGFGATTAFDGIVPNIDVKISVDTSAPNLPNSFGFGFQSCVGAQCAVTASISVGAYFDNSSQGFVPPFLGFDNAIFSLIQPANPFERASVTAGNFEPTIHDRFFSLGYTANENGLGLISSLDLFNAMNFPLAACSGLHCEDSGSFITYESGELVCGNTDCTDQVSLQFVVPANLRSVTVTSVPEPNSLPLLIMAMLLAFVGAAQRLRNNKARTSQVKAPLNRHALPELTLEGSV